MSLSISERAFVSTVSRMALNTFSTFFVSMAHAIQSLPVEPPFVSVLDELYCLLQLASICAIYYQEEQVNAGWERKGDQLLRSLGESICGEDEF